MEVNSFSIVKPMGSARVHLVLRRVELVYQYLALVELMPGVRPNR